MLFKSLQIQGFKSFVDKTIIEFPKGITAIVGPNGSGKSNIMDALRWVFGEQRASELRGGEMMDVVFSGSEKRRLAGYAEVGLTLAEVDPEVARKWGTFSEITISRKIYRTGEREYYINNRKCRLKDIRDIFFDTGLGAKSISIIEQERVTKIVNSTPEELRYFLEETAGVVRYKERRRDAESRLRSTHGNLDRINDLLQHVDEDRQRLFVQVQKLQKYNELRTEKESLEKTFICVTYAKLLDDNKGHKGEIDKLREGMAHFVSANQEQINLESSFVSKQDSIRELLREISKRFNELKNLQVKYDGDIRQLESSLESADGHKDELTVDIDVAKRRLNQMTERLEDLTYNLEDAQELAQEFEEQVQDHSLSLSDYRGSLDRINIQLKEIDTEYLKATQELTECINSINIKQAELSSQDNSIVRLKRERDSLADEVLEIGERYNSYEKSVASIHEERGHFKKKLVDHNSELDKRSSSLNELKSLYSQTDIQIKTLKNQMEFIQSDINSKLSGGDYRELVDMFGAEPFIYAVKDSPDEEKLHFGDILVFPDAGKDKVIDYISSSDMSVRFIFQHDLSQLRESARIDPITSKLYRDGVIYRSIGEDDTSYAILQSQEKLQEISLEHSLLENVFNQYDEQLSELTATYNIISEELIDMQSKLKDYDIQYSTAKTNLDNLLEQKGRISRNNSIIDKEIVLAQESTQQMEQDVIELETLKAELGKKQRLVIQRRDEADAKATDLSETIERKREEHAVASRELVKYSERREVLSVEQEQLQESRQETVDSIKLLTHRLLELTDIKVEEWKEQLTEAKGRSKKTSEEILVVAEEVQSQEREQREAENALLEARSKLGDINNKMHEMDLQIVQIQGRIESTEQNVEVLSQQMIDSYNVDINDIWEDYAKGDFSRQKLTSDMAKIDTQVQELGSLNMVAQVEYDEKTEQYESQKIQKDDVEEAVANLNNLIREIDESTVELFEETFNSVRKNFIDVFTRFFGSGSADLTMTDPDNILTTGVEMSINPPGKKVSHKNLLSGGEKALGALTLLFALFLQKPTPFCFLDEVDAPLDDANVGRFIGMVNTMSQDTQFVIITHKHQTMAAADSLYGVTMQEGGVSTLLSVELKSKEV